MSENVARLLWEAHRTRKEGPVAVERQQRVRLAEMVVHARESSPYYRELYRDLPKRIEDPTLLPVTNKKGLMERFGDWVTDREATFEGVRSFIDDPDLVGERFLGKYTVTTTSGITGTRGLFVLDERTVAVNQVLALRMMRTFLDMGGFAKIVARGGRCSLVIATGGHFMSAAIAARVRKGRWGQRKFQVVSVHAPLADMVADLNRFRPAIVIGYASAVAVLAAEQEAGRLRIRPVLVQPAGEGLAEGEYDRIAEAFGAEVRDAYSATECTFIGYSCEQRWQHVNADWVVLEPVDAEYHPVPPGQRSHTVLISNLANRVQLILRYDLGDGVLGRPDPCPCGNPLPAIRVQGRSADVLTFPADRDESVTIPPLVFGTLVDRTPGIELFQIVQTAPATLRVRLRPAPGADPERAWQAVRAEIARLLFDRGLRHVAVERAGEPPEQSRGGKYRTVIPLKP